MSEQLIAPPRFSGRVNVPAYYLAVSGIVEHMRTTHTLREICHMLNASNYRTPRGLEFNKSRLTGFLRNTKAV